MARCKHCGKPDVGNYIKHMWNNHPVLSHNELRPNKLKDREEIEKLRQSIVKSKLASEIFASREPAHAPIEAVLIAGQWYNVDPGSFKKEFGRVSFVSRLLTKRAVLECKESDIQMTMRSLSKDIDSAISYCS